MYASGNTSKFYRTSKKSNYGTVVFLILLFLTLIYFWQKKYFWPNKNVEPEADKISKVVPPQSVFNKYFSLFKGQKDDEPIKNNADDIFVELTTQLEMRGSKYSLYIENLNTGKKYEYKSGTEMYGASLFKVPVAVAVLKEIQDGNISFDTKLSYSDENYQEGTGIITGSDNGVQFSVRNLIKYLIDHSDNSAQSMIINKIGEQKVSNVVLQNSSAKGNTVFVFENIVSTADMSDFLKNVYIGTTLTQDNKNLLFDEMTETSFDDRISANLDEDLSFAHKIGTWPESGSWHDCGIVFGDKDVLVVCLMSQNTSYNDFLEVSSNVARFINEL